MANAPGTNARSGSSGRRLVIGAVVLLAGIALAFFLTRGDDDEPTGGTAEVNLLTNAPSCNLPGVNPRRSGACPQGKGFSAAPYAKHGDAYDCPEFATQADAQAVLKVDPKDPNKLDPDHDGVACRELARGGPTDLTPIKSIAGEYRCKRSDPRTAQCPQRNRAFDPQQYVLDTSDLWDCDRFASQADAQAVLRITPADPNKLDEDGDGIACPDLPSPKDTKRVERPSDS